LENYVCLRSNIDSGDCLYRPIQQADGRRRERDDGLPVKNPRTEIDGVGQDPCQAHKSPPSRPSPEMAGRLEAVMPEQSKIVVLDGKYQISNRRVGLWWCLNDVNEIES
jgi:hypothetical protein